MKFKGKKILVGVTGGIAVYKTCSLVNFLLKEGAEVRVIMTESAKKFVTPLTFQALTNHSVYDDLWDIKDSSTVEHISLAKWPDLVLISPVTANTIAKLAMGLADNLLTTTVLATLTNVKILLVPAMNTQMWTNVLVQKNINILLDTGKFHLVEPRSGVLACRDEGKGKIADADSIMNAAELLF